ncbi:DMT family transporter [Polaribacter aquimarinus]|mgnify:CR=1 FL=1|uniref:EamA family transporter n=1 Tax=Polaribacter aquimarinus TaxID=2100726 RepID=A0A2U2J7R9_9FLAO|nr:EamA family transporter [Polaribacter aquimarinus]PWG04390.1 EamA family transporter [Polaribacter aquimarinus]
MIFRNSKALIILAFFAIYVIWGSTYLFNKIAVTELPPFFLASIRFFTAGCMMILIAFLTKVNLKISRKEFKNICITAFFFLVYGNSVFVWSLQFVDSGFGSLIASTNPLFVLIMMRIIDRKPMQKKSMIGVILGILGMILLITQEELVTTQNTLIGILVMLTCVISWSYGSLFVAKATLPKNFLVSTGYQMIFGSLFLAIVSFAFQENWSSPLNWTTNVQVSMIILIIFGGIIAFTAFNFLLKRVSPEKVSTSAYVNPVIALFMGWYFLDENLSAQSIIASVILLTGVYFITSRKRQ